MNKPKAKRLWQCGSCSEMHYDKDEAIDCCKPGVHEHFGCPGCGKVYEAEQKAVSCCEETERCPCCARDYGSGHIQAFAVRVAGHCNTCNPLFSIEQKWLIEDQYVEAGGEHQSLTA